MVDQRERSNDQEESMRIGQDRHAQQLWTFLPVIVKEDSKGHTVDLRPAIKGWQKNPQSGQVEAVEISHLGSCPVHFVQGGEFVITHPVKKDDEAIVAFATRCIDGWWDKGDVQAEPYRRSHSLSDGMYIGGVRSNPRALGGDQRQQQGGQGGGQQRQQQNNTRAPSTSTIQIRTERGNHYVELTGEEQQGRSPVDIIIPFAEGQEAIEGRPGPCVNIVCKRANIKAEEKVHIDSPLVEITGSLKVKGEVTAKADVQASQDFGGSQNRHAELIASLTPTPRAGEEVNLSTHRHRDTESGTGQSGPPAAGT